VDEVVVVVVLLLSWLVSVWEVGVGEESLLPKPSEEGAEVAGENLTRLW
jgi:hypothetical protein